MSENTAPSAEPGPDAPQSDNAVSTEPSEILVAAFFGLSEPIPETLVSPLEKKMAYFSSLENEKLLLQARLSLSETGYQKKLAALTKNNSDLSALVEKRTSDAAHLEAANSELSKKVLELTSQLAHQESQYAELKSSAASASASQNAKLQTLAQVIEENESLKKSLSESKKTIVALKSEALEHEGALQKVLSEKNALIAEKDEAITRLGLVQKNLTWYQSAYETKTKEYNEYRLETTSSLSAARAEASRATREHLEISRELSDAKEKIGELRKQLENTIFQRDLAQNEASVAAESFFNEIASKDKIIELLKDTNASLKLRAEELKKEFEAEASSRNQTVLELEQKLKELEAECTRLNGKIIELEKTLESDTEANALTPAARALVGKVGGLSLLEMYAEYSALRKELANERHLKEAMQNQIDGFVVELEQKIPLIEATTAKNRFLEQELTSLSATLEEESQSKRELSRKLNQYSMEQKTLQLTITLLLKTKRDLSKQVQYLLIQHSLLLSESAEPLSSAEKEHIEKILNNQKVSDKHIAALEKQIKNASGDLPETDTDRLISDRLVMFSSINELQVKNAELLRIVRALASKLEAEEQEKQLQLKNFELDAITEATEAIETLQEDITHLKARLAACERERDMYKNGSSHRLLEAAPATETSSDLVLANKSLKSELVSVEKSLQSVKTESKKIIDDLLARVDTVTMEKTTLMGELSAARSSEAILKDRYENILAELARKQSELDNLKKLNSQLTDSVSRLDNSTATLAAQLVGIRSELDVAKNTIRNLESEKALLDAAKRRVQEEVAAVREERSQMQKLVTSVQQSGLSREAELKETNERLLARASKSETELSSVQMRASQLEERLQEAQKAATAAEQSHRERTDALNAQLLAAREQLAVKGGEISVLQSKVEILEKQASSSTAYINTVLSALGDDTQDKVRELEGALARAKEELEQAENDVKHYKEIAEGAEKALESMNTAASGEKEQASKRISELEAEIEKLKKDVATRESEKEGIQKEVQAKVEEIERINKELKDLGTRVASSDQIKAEFNAQLEIVQKEVEQFKKAAAEQKSNYEAELTKHAETVRKNSETAQEANELRTRVVELEKKVSAADARYNDSVRSWEAQKQTLEESLEKASSQVEEYKRQNTFLHSQLQVSEPSVESEDSADSGLKKVLLFVRKERDIAQAELESRAQECTRLAAELGHARDELAAAQNALRQSKNAEETDAQRQAEQRALSDLSILRESNSVLRNELNMLREQVSKLETEKGALKNSVQPLKEEIVRLKSTISMQETTIASLKEEAKQWSERVSALLSGTKTDEKETEAIKKEAATLKKECGMLRKENLSLKVDIERLKKDVDHVKSESEKERESLNKEVASMKSEIARASESKALLRNRFNNIILSKNQELKDIKKSLEEAQNELKKLAENKKQAEAKPTDQKNNLKNLNQQNAELTKTVAQLRKEKANEEKLKENFKKEINELTEKFHKDKAAEIDKLNKELEIARANSVKTENGEPPDKEGSASINVEELKKQWAAEQEPLIVGRIEKAKDDLRSSLTAPTREAIEKLANFKFESYKKKFAEEVRAALEKAAKDSFEKRIAELERKHQEDIKNAVNSAIEKLKQVLNGANPEGFDEHQKFFKSVLDKRFELGQNSSAIKMRLKDSKIDRLTKALEKYEANSKPKTEEVSAGKQNPSPPPKEEVKAAGNNEKKREAEEEAAADGTKKVKVDEK